MQKSYSTAASSPSKSVDQALSDLKKHLSTTKGRENLRKSLPFTKMNSLENIDLNELWIESENAADNLNSIVLKKVCCHVSMSAARQIDLIICS